MSKPRKRARQERPSRRLPDFSRLPARVAPQDLTTTHDPGPVPDPQGGRDTETEFMLRNAGF
jgi:hypothetical protein